MLVCVYLSTPEDMYVHNTMSILVENLLNFFLLVLHKIFLGVKLDKLFSNK